MMQPPPPTAQTPPQPVTLGPPMGTTYFTNMYHTGGPISASLQASADAPSQLPPAQTAAMESSTVVMQEAPGQMASQVQQLQPPPSNNLQSGQCSASESCPPGIFLSSHQGAAEGEGDVSTSQCSTKGHTNKCSAQGRPKELNLETTDSDTSSRAQETREVSTHDLGEKLDSHHKGLKEDVGSTTGDLLTSPSGDVDGAGYQDSGCGSDVSSGVGDALCSVMEAAVSGSQPPSPAAARSTALPLLDTAAATEDGTPVRSAHSSESSDTHSDSSSQHSLSNISSISTQSDVSVASNKIMKAHTARKGKYGVSANANLVRPLKDFPPRFQKIISQNPNIRSEQFEGLALVRHAHENKHIVVPPSPSTTDTSLSASGDESAHHHHSLSHHSTHQFNPNAQSFIPHQTQNHPGPGGAQRQLVQQEQTTYNAGFDSNAHAGCVSMVNGMFLPPPNTSTGFAPAPSNVPPVSGDGSMNSVAYSDNSVCCDDSSKAKSGMQSHPHAPTYTIHIISVAQPGSGPQGNQAGGGNETGNQGQACNNTAMPQSPLHACGNTSALSSHSAGYPVLPAAHVSGGGEGLMCPPQPPFLSQGGTVFYNSAGSGFPPAQHYNPYVPYPATPQLYQGQVASVAGTTPPASVIYSHPPTAPSNPPLQHQSQEQQQQQAAAVQFASLPPPPPPGVNAPQFPGQSCGR